MLGYLYRKRFGSKRASANRKEGDRVGAGLGGPAPTLLGQRINTIFKGQAVFLDCLTLAGETDMLSQDTDSQLHAHAVWRPTTVKASTTPWTKPASHLLHSVCLLKIRIQNLNSWQFIDCFAMSIIKFNHPWKHYTYLDTNIHVQKCAYEVTYPANITMLSKFACSKCNYQFQVDTVRIKIKPWYELEML